MPEPYPAAVEAAQLPDELPPGAVELAAAAIHRLWSPGDPCGCTVEGEHEGTIAADTDAASEAMWAAWPLIAADATSKERQRWRAALETHINLSTDEDGRHCAGCLQPWPCPDADLLDGDTP